MHINSAGENFLIYLLLMSSFSAFVCFLCYRWTGVNSQVGLCLGSNLRISLQFWRGSGGRARGAREGEAIDHLDIFLEVRSEAERQEGAMRCLSVPVVLACLPCVPAIASTPIIHFHPALTPGRERGAPAAASKKASQRGKACPGR